MQASQDSTTKALVNDKARILWQAAKVIQHRTTKRYEGSERIWTYKQISTCYQANIAFDSFTKQTARLPRRSEGLCCLTEVYGAHQGWLDSV